MNASLKVCLQPNSSLSGEKPPTTERGKHPGTRNDHELFFEARFDCGVKLGQGDQV